MSKVIIIYYSKTRNTEKMAHFVEKGVKEEKVEVKIKKVKEVNLSELLGSDGIIIGFPTYFRSMASTVKELIEKEC